MLWNGPGSTHGFGSTYGLRARVEGSWKEVDRFEPRSLSVNLTGLGLLGDGFLKS